MWPILQSAIRTHLRLTLTRPTFQITLIAQPVIMASVTYMLYRAQDASVLAYYTMLGSGIAGIWSSIVFSSAGDINRERFTGTLQPLLLAPTPILLPMLGKIAGNALLASTSLIISWLFTTVVLQVPVTWSHPAAFGLAMALLLISANLLALCLSAVFLLSRSTVIMQNFLEYPILIVSGLFFPIQVLPGWVQPLGWILPLNWGVRALHLSLSPAALSSDFGVAVLMMGGLAGVYLAVAAQLFRVVERRVRLHATLDIY